MTLEELKAEAKAQGYRLVKITPYVKLMPCKCGRKLIDSWVGINGIHFYKCPNCGEKGGYAETERGARIKWNESMKELEVESNG